MYVYLLVADAVWIDHLCVPIQIVTAPSYICGLDGCLVIPAGDHHPYLYGVAGVWYPIPDASHPVSYVHACTHCLLLNIL